MFAREMSTLPQINNVLSRSESPVFRENVKSREFDTIVEHSNAHLLFFVLCIFFSDQPERKYETFDVEGSETRGPSGASVPVKHS